MGTNEFALSQYGITLDGTEVDIGVIVELAHRDPMRPYFEDLRSGSTPNFDGGVVEINQNTFRDTLRRTINDLQSQIVNTQYQMASLKVLEKFLPHTGKLPPKGVIRQLMWDEALKKAVNDPTIEEVLWYDPVLHLGPFRYTVRARKAMTESYVAEIQRLKNIKQLLKYCREMQDKGYDMSLEIADYEAKLADHKKQAEAA